MDNLKPTERVTGSFTKYCQKVIPLYFDESMSYYEQLCSFTNKLHEVISVVNNNGESIDELQNLYEQLKLYVDDYFKNLDVQNEINNKLDEMASSGELQEIISKYLDSTAIFGFTNVEEMINAQNLINGSYAKTTGYYNINDNGGATYKIRTRTFDDVIDNGSIIAMKNENLVAELIITGKINAMNWGLNESNFSEKLNIILQKFDDPIYIPYGDYIINEPININKNYVNLTCDGNIMCNDNITMFNITGSYCNISLNGDNIGNKINNENVGTVINLGSPTKSVGWNVININSINNVKNGLLLSPNNYNGVHYNKINFNFINATYCINFKPGDDDKPWINENTFTGGRVLGGTGIYMRKGEQQTDRFNGNKFINIGYETLQCAIDIDDAFYNTFDRCRMNESLQGDYWIKCGNRSQSNKFTMETTIKLNQINDLSTSYNNGNIYEVILTTDNGIWIGNKFKVFNNNAIILPGHTIRSDVITINNYDKTGEIENNIFSDEATIVVGGSANDTDYTTIVPASVFNYNAIKKLNVYIGYRNGTSQVNIKDTNNNVLLDNSQLPTGSLSRQWFRLEYHYSTLDSSKPWILSAVNALKLPN